MLLNLVIMLSMVADSNGKYEWLFIGTTVYHIAKGTGHTNHVQNRLSTKLNDTFKLINSFRSLIRCASE